MDYARSIYMRLGGRSHPFAFTGSTIFSILLIPFCFAWLLDLDWRIRPKDLFCLYISGCHGESQARAQCGMLSIWLLDGAPDWGRGECIYRVCIAISSLVVIRTEKMFDIKMERTSWTEALDMLPMDNIRSVHATTIDYDEHTLSTTALNTRTTWPMIFDC